MSDFSHIPDEEDKRKKAPYIQANFATFQGAMRCFKRVVKAFNNDVLSQNRLDNWLKVFNTYKNLYRVQLDETEQNEILKRIEALEEHFNDTKS